MIIARDPQSLDRALARVRRRRESIGFVPTMGALHDGHAALIRECRRQCRVTVVSLYVNPLQFDSLADYRRYPRPLQKDLAFLRRRAVDVAYCPSPGVFPAESGIRLTEQRVSRLYEGKIRPGHFEGVLTIVAKLFLHVRPTHAFFGMKDFQQVWLVNRMLEEYPMGVRLVPVPTVRDTLTGLACSSRNMFLGKSARARAGWIYPALIETRAMSIRDARSHPAALVDHVRRVLRSRGIRVEYAAIVDARDFSSPRGRLSSRGSYRLLVAVRIGGIHLIDNMPVGRSGRTQK